VPIGKQYGNVLQRQNLIVLKVITRKIAICGRKPVLLRVPVTYLMLLARIHNASKFTVKLNKTPADATSGHKVNTVCTYRQRTSSLSVSLWACEALYITTWRNAMPRSRSEWLI